MAVCTCPVNIYITFYSTSIPPDLFSALFPLLDSIWRHKARHFHKAWKLAEWTGNLHDTQWHCKNACGEQNRYGERAPGGVLTHTIARVQICGNSTSKPTASRENHTACVFLSSGWPWSGQKWGSEICQETLYAFYRWVSESVMVRCARFSRHAPCDAYQFNLTPREWKIENWNEFSKSFFLLPVR